MNNKKFYPVIHHRDLKTTEEQIQKCLEVQVDGVFLINMDHSHVELNPALKLAREMNPQWFIGVNRLGLNNDNISKCIKIDNLVNGYWVDNPGLNYDDPNQIHLLQLTTSIKNRKIIDPEFQFFGSICFKTHPWEHNEKVESRLARGFGWIPTTSGRGTGVAAELDKIKNIKEILNSHPLAIASGIDSENVDLYLPYVDYFLVATGISKNFYEFDLEKMKCLNDKIKNNVLDA